MLRYWIGRWLCRRGRHNLVEIERDGVNVGFSVNVAYCTRCGELHRLGHTFVFELPKGHDEPQPVSFSLGA
jgi:hypothetical protein